MPGARLLRTGRRVPRDAPPRVKLQVELARAAWLVCNVVQKCSCRAAVPLEHASSFKDYLPPRRGPAPKGSFMCTRATVLLVTASRAVLRHTSFRTHTSPERPVASSRVTTGPRNTYGLRLPTTPARHWPLPHHPAQQELAALLAQVGHLSPALLRVRVHMIARYSSCSAHHVWLPLTTLRF